MNQKQDPTRSAPTLAKGRNIILAMGACATGLVGFMYFIRNRNNTLAEREANPPYDQPYGNFAKRVNQGLPHLDYSQPRDISTPTKEHNTHKISTESYKKSPEAADPTRRYYEPTPQRPKGDGSDLVYSKSPDFVANYEKKKYMTHKEHDQKE